MILIWKDGHLLPADEAGISVRDRGFLLGDGLFETIRVHRGALLRLEAHWRRLQESAAVLDIPLGNVEELTRALHDTITANGIQEGSARLTITRGCGGRGLDLPEDPAPTRLITVTSHAPLVTPVHLRLDTRYRRDERSPLSKVKALGYLPNVLARRDARSEGADDALMLNTAGGIACATAATVLVMQAGEWITPALEEGALPGTARALLIREEGVREGRITAADAQKAKALLLVNALSLRPVLSLDGRNYSLAEEGMERFSRRLGFS